MSSDQVFTQQLGPQHVQYGVVLSQQDLLPNGTNKGQAKTYESTKQIKDVPAYFYDNASVKSKSRKKRLTMNQYKKMAESNRVSNLEARASQSRLKPDDTVLSLSHDPSELTKDRISSFRAPARSVRIQNLTERVFSAKRHVNELSSKDPLEIMSRNIQN